MARQPSLTDLRLSDGFLCGNERLAHWYSTPVTPTSATGLIAAYIALNLASRLWVNAGNYGPPIGIEPTPTALNISLQATK